MLRYWAVGLLALVPLAADVARAGGKKIPDKEIRYQGQLTNDDPKDRKRNSAHKVYKVRMQKGSAYQIDMKSRQFDSYLRLEDSKGRELAEDDDSGGMLDAQIIFNCTRDDEYKVIATAFNENGVGMFTLTIKKRGAAPKSTSAHTTLIDKAAPDFQGDFAVNGPPVKLSDLKGKVVLLNFWDVRSPACEAVQPKLSAWQKAHKAEGLEVVGVTFYKVDIKQNLAFDATSGKLKTVEKATRQTEQALLKDYAAYHKLDYRLLTIPYDDAMKAFDAYSVNGFPQFVLIDRKGVVRFIRVGENEATLAAVEAELKKLLAEK
jgi:thiol-disulfide isomerase/thioredoxin